MNRDVTCFCVGYWNGGFSSVTHVAFVLCNATICILFVKPIALVEIETGTFWVAATGTVRLLHRQSLKLAQISVGTTTCFVIPPCRCGPIRNARGTSRGAVVKRWKNGGGSTGVVQRHCDVAVGHVSSPNLQGSIFADAHPHLPKWVLTDRNGVRVQQNLFRSVRHIAKVVAHDQRRGGDAPNGHLCPFFVLGHAMRTNQQHVHVVPMPRSGKGDQSFPVLTPVLNDARQTRPIALNVVPISPQIATVVDEFGKGLFRFVASVDVGGPRAGVDNVAARGFQGRPHRLVTFFVVIGGTTTVYLHVVDAPLGKGLGIQRFHVGRSRVTSAGGGGFGRVQAKGGPFGVHVVAERFETGGEARGIGGQFLCGGVPWWVFAFPTIVHMDARVAGVDVPIGGERIRLTFVHLFTDAGGWVNAAVDVATKQFPRHPTHGGGASETVPCGDGGEGAEREQKIQHDQGPQRG